VSACLTYSPLAHSGERFSAFAIPRARRTAGPGVAAPAWERRREDREGTRPRHKGQKRKGRATSSSTEGQRRRERPSERSRGAGDLIRFKSTRSVRTKMTSQNGMTSLINQTHSHSVTTRFQIPYRFQGPRLTARPLVSSRLVSPLTPWPPARRSAACRPGSHRRPAGAPGTSAPPSSSP